MAHIVSEKPEGPRGKHYLPPGEHDKHPNLMLMCLDHHTEIDTAEDKYPVELLRQIKKDHEDAIEKGVFKQRKRITSK
jgi:hypothetical protein